MDYEQKIDKTLDTVNTVYSTGRRIAYVFMGLFFFLIGGVLTLWGIFNYSDRVKEMDSFEKTTGAVVRLREVPPTENSGITYAPVISFTDAKGNKYEYESKNSSDPPAYEIGEKVAMRYDMKDPDDAFIDTFWGRWSGTLIIFVFPLVVFPIGLWMLFSAFRGKRKKKNNPENIGNSGGIVSIG